ncbi:MAG: hypothetical protein R2731_10545 [Nocardioides sp.]
MGARDRPPWRVRFEEAGWHVEEAAADDPEGLAIAEAGCRAATVPAVILLARP